jgi:CheY-like chemotaxis protein
MHAAHAAAVSCPPPPSATRYRRRVLLIDDEPAFTKLLRLGLERIGHYVVESCNDSLLALQIASDFQPDAILLDVMMPGQDGADLYREMQQHPMLRQIPTIMLTSLVDRHEVSWPGFAARGGMLLMPKPAPIQRIHECLSQILDRSNRRPGRGAN